MKGPIQIGPGQAGPFETPTTHYDCSYDDRKRWVSYWYQIREIISRKPDSVLEIGPGNKTVSNYLNHKGCKVTTVDIDPGVKPAVVANVTRLPFKNDVFDTVACYEVLEHLEFNQFINGLREMEMVSKDAVIISLPDAGGTWNWKIPLFGWIIIPKIREKKPEHQFDGEHYWEINKKGYPLDKIKKKIIQTGLELENDYLIPEWTYHRIFTLTVSH